MDSRLFVEAVQELNSGFVKLLESMSALRALSSIAVSGQAEEELLDGALQVLVQNQDLERCSVFMLQSEGVLANVAGLDWDDLVQREGGRRGGRSVTVFRPGEGIVGLAAQTGDLQHCRECHTDERFLSTCDESKPLPATVGSLISVPIKAAGEVLGVLNVSHPHANFFSESHERTLWVFSNFLAQMLMNNRLVHRMDRLVQERTAQLEQALADAEALKHRYERLSVIDELTELHNRRYFFPEARSALARAVRQHQPFAILLIDVDHFKRVNDRCGHAAGDQVLREVALCIRKEVREGDILARFGGEEFIVALPDTDQEGAMMLAERIREVLRECRWPVGEERLSVTLSIGLASRGERKITETQALLDRIVQEADQALYFGKHNGRDQCRAYSEIACDLDPAG